jgi:uncharacterized coiled-coil DUF342 family protein
MNIAEIKQDAMKQMIGELQAKVDALRMELATLARQNQEMHAVLLEQVLAGDESRP